MSRGDAGRDVRTRQVSWLAAAALAGALAGAAVSALARQAPAEAPEWVTRQLEAVMLESLALRREIGQMRFEFTHSLAEMRARRDSVAVPGPEEDGTSR